MANGIKACMRCLGCNLKRHEAATAPENDGSVMEAALGSSALAYQCGDCGFVGNPVLFLSDDDRKKFIELRNVPVKDNAAVSGANEQKPVKACMNCGSLSISSPDALRRNSVQKCICNDCGYVGACATFGSEALRLQHVSQRKNGR